MSNAFLRKTVENARKHRDIKLVTTEKGRNYLMSEPYYLSYCKVFQRKSISNRNEKNSDTYE